VLGAAAAAAQVLFLLLQLQLHTTHWRREAAEEVLAALEPLAEQLPAAATPLCAAQLQVHHRLLQVSTAAWGGFTVTKCAVKG
jgi:hypothetical protein